MKRSFSLRGLLIGIAALAGLLGWIKDHRRLSRELYDAKTKLSVQDDRLETMINQMLSVYIKDVSTTVRYVGYDNKDDKLTLSEGELSAVAAFTLAASRIPVIDMDNVAIDDLGQAAFSPFYDVTVEGKVQHYRLKPNYRDSMGRPGGRP